MHFYCEKLYLWAETGTRELNRPLGAENIKRRGGGENLAGVQPPTPPINLHPVYITFYTDKQ